MTQDKNFHPCPQRKEQRDLLRKKIHSLLSYKCASKTKEKESSQSKIRRKQKKKKFPDQRSEENKENIQNGLRTRQCLNKHTGLSQANEKRKDTTAGDTRSGPLPLITNQNFVRRRLFRPALNKNRKKERKFPIKEWEKAKKESKY